MRSVTSSAIVDARINALLQRCAREVNEGLLPSCQIAIGFEGELVANEAFGTADDDTTYCLFSATKAFVAAAFWQLISEGVVDPTSPVATYLDVFDDDDKRSITVEQVMLHSSGFPHAPLGPPAWDSSPTRREAMSRWRLNWEPGTRYEYHPTSAHWVLAEIMIEVTGNDYRDEVAARVTSPLGLPRILGITPSTQTTAELVLTGEVAGPDELEAVFGVRELPANEVTDDVLLRFNSPEVMELGVPGGGGWGRASDLALFYQGLLHNPGELWEPNLLADVTGRVRNRMPDPMGVPANRSLGLVLAGSDGHSHLRGMGRTLSAEAFGHNGAGGQIAWADPATGLSIGYTTNGLDRHQIRQPRRTTSIASLAGLCTTPLD